MGRETGIQWTDSTFNGWYGCTEVGPGCDECYARALMDTRLHRAEWGAGKPRVRTSAAYWRQPLQWQRDGFARCTSCRWRGEVKALAGNFRCPNCGSEGTEKARRRAFAFSLGDVFDNEVDPQWRADFFDVVKATPGIDWLVVTKRIGNVQKMLEAATCMSYMPRNVWLGATICDRAEMLRDAPKLLGVEARVHFWSAEPMLGSFGHIPRELLPDWIILGGESGPKARNFVVDDAIDVIRQCSGSGTRVFTKQAGARPVNLRGDRYPGITHPKGADIGEWPHALRAHAFPAAAS